MEGSNSHRDCSPPFVVLAIRRAGKRKPPEFTPASTWKDQTLTATVRHRLLYLQYEELARESRRNLLLATFKVVAPHSGHQGWSHHPLTGAAIV
jgi:hypothetical protein